MSLVVDQTWVKDWEGKPTIEQKDLIVSWLSFQKKEWRSVLHAFPPFCLVKARRMMDTPCPFSVGFVSAYYDDKTVAVQQEPDTNPVPVLVEDLEVVGFWKHLNHEAIKRLFS
jgi:hypothetical protein